MKALKPGWRLDGVVNWSEIRAAAGGSNIRAAPSSINVTFLYGVTIEKLACSCFADTKSQSRPFIAAANHGSMMFSQFGQDHFVLQILNGKRGGFFLDSGAGDGIRSSNTYLLETSFEWSGVCVEPNDSMFLALKQNRRCQCLNCCIYDREGEVNFLEAAKMLGGIMDEYHPSHLEFARKTFDLKLDGNGALPTVRKKARTIGTILRECKAPPIIDYWSLDTEGSELKILKSFPFSEYSCKVITVEHNNLPIRGEIRYFLESVGYQRIKQMRIDDCYTKPDSSHQ